MAIAARAAAGRCDLHERRRQLLGLGAPLLRVQAVPRPSSRRRAARWATACRRRSPPSCCTRSGSSSAIAGDGDFLMTGQELATAVQHDAAIVVLVVNNGMYGTIRMHQERHYPGRVSGTDLVNPDFAALARAFGAYGAAVERTEDFAAAFDEALACGRPALVELRVDPEALTPRQTLTEIREAAQARLVRVVGSTDVSTNEPEGAADGKVVRKHGDRRLARRGLGAHPRLQRPRDLAQRPRLAERDRGRQGGRPGRRDPQLHARPTARTSASSCSRTPTSSARTPTTSRRRRSTSTTTAPRSG